VRELLLREPAPRPGPVLLLREPARRPEAARPGPVVRSQRSPAEGPQGPHSR